MSCRFTHFFTVTKKWTRFERSQTKDPIWSKNVTNKAVASLDVMGKVISDFYRMKNTLYAVVKDKNWCMCMSNSIVVTLFEYVYVVGKLSFLMFFRQVCLICWNSVPIGAHLDSCSHSITLQMFTPYPTITKHPKFTESGTLLLFTSIYFVKLKSQKINATMTCLSISVIQFFSVTK